MKNRQPRNTGAHTLILITTQCLQGMAYYNTIYNLGADHENELLIQKRLGFVDKANEAIIAVM